MKWLNRVLNRAPKAEQAPMTERDEILAAVAPMSHESWRTEYKADNPEATSRFRELKAGEDAEWIKKNKKKPIVRMGDEGYEADILNLSFNELPPSRKDEALISTTIAVDELMTTLRLGGSLDDFVEKTAKIIHIQWLGRHRLRLEDDIRDWEAEGGHEKDIALAREQLLPYEELSDEQKDYDRKPAKRVLDEYRRRHPEA